MLTEKLNQCVSRLVGNGGVGNAVLWDILAPWTDLFVPGNAMLATHTSETSSILQVHEVRIYQD